MADNESCGRFQRVEQARQVADQMEDGILIDRLGGVALAIAAHVQRDGVEAGGGERVDLVAPGIPGFRKAVAHQHEGPLALLDYI